MYLHRVSVREGRIGHHVLSLSRQRRPMYVYAWEAEGGEMSHADLTSYTASGFTLTIITSIYISLAVHILSLSLSLARLLRV